MLIANERAQNGQLNSDAIASLLVNQFFKKIPCTKYSSRNYYGYIRKQNISVKSSKISTGQGNESGVSAMSCESSGNFIPRRDTSVSF